MRHGKKVNHLSRTSAHRKAMLSNMAASLILHKRIKTTTAKAKALKVYVEPLVTKSKNDTTASRRIVFSYLQNKFAVTELFREVSQKIMDRPGGYTRIIKLPNRIGDNAEMCIIELVDYNTVYNTETKKVEKKTTRRSGAKNAAKKTNEGREPAAKKTTATTSTDEVAEPVTKKTTKTKAASPAKKETAPAKAKPSVKAEPAVAENEPAVSTENDDAVVENESVVSVETEPVVEEKE